MDVPGGWDQLLLVLVASVWGVYRLHNPVRRSLRVMLRVGRTCEIQAVSTPPVANNRDGGQDNDCRST
jgi:hypothetical protein